MSTGSVVSLTWAGTSTTAIEKATTASGSVIEEDRAPPELLEQAPATSGPSEAMPPPSADHSAIAFVRPGPDHSAVISASVVG